MSEKRFVERMCAGLKTPEQMPVFAARQYSIQENQRRAKRLLSATGELCNRSLDRADWTEQPDRTLARLPQGGRLEVFHASGAMRLVTGIDTMDKLFDKIEPKEQLQKLVEAAMARLRLGDWMGQRESLAFERLWQIKACAAERNGKAVDPVLCRAVGAYRQSVEGIPVLGAASVAVQIAAGGELDSVSVQLLESSGDPIESAALISPDQAAKQVYAQLEGLMGRSKVPVGELKATAQPLQLGYVHFGRRKATRLLAPHYIAAIEIDGEEAQAYQFIVQATQRTFVPLCHAGQQAPAPALRRAA